MSETPPDPVDELRRALPEGALPPVRLPLGRRVRLQLVPAILLLLLAVYVSAVVGLGLVTARALLFSHTQIGWMDTAELAVFFFLGFLALLKPLVTPAAHPPARVHLSQRRAAGYLAWVDELCKALGVRKPVRVVADADTEIAYEPRRGLFGLVLQRRELSVGLSFVATHDAEAVTHALVRALSGARPGTCLRARTLATWIDRWFARVIDEEDIVDESLAVLAADYAPAGRFLVRPFQVLAAGTRLLLRGLRGLGRLHNANSLRATEAAVADDTLDALFDRTLEGFDERLAEAHERVFAELETSRADGHLPDDLPACVREELLGDTARTPRDGAALFERFDELSGRVTMRYYRAERWSIGGRVALVDVARAAATRRRRAEDAALVSRKLGWEPEVPFALPPAATASGNETTGPAGEPAVLAALEDAVARRIERLADDAPVTEAIDEILRIRLRVARRVDELAARTSGRSHEAAKLVSALEHLRRSSRAAIEVEIARRVLAELLELEVPEGRHERRGQRVACVHLDGALTRFLTALSGSPYAYASPPGSVTLARQLLPRKPARHLAIALERAAREALRRHLAYGHRLAADLVRVDAERAAFALENA